MLQEQILRRGMIRVDAMPISTLSREWSAFQIDLSLKHTDIYRNITLAIYINEYAFCWKQDSALAEIMRT